MLTVREPSKLTVKDIERRIKDGKWVDFTDDLCLCGHRCDEHFLNAANTAHEELWCGHEDRVNWLLHCECREYRVDLLKHMEILHEEKQSRK